MKVFQINCSTSGSTGALARSIHEQLLRMGEQSFFAYGMGADAGENTMQISNPIDYRFHTYAGRLVGLHGYFSAHQTKKLISKLDLIDPDIVHLHNLHGDYINIPMLLRYLKDRQKKVMTTLHDCWLFTGGCAHYTLAKCDKWKSECGGCSQLMDYPKSYIFDTSRWCLKEKKSMLAGFDCLKVITVSDWLGQQAKQSHLAQYEIKTIYNGINTQVFRRYAETTIREKYGIGSDDIVVLGVSSCWNGEGKGLKQFVKLSALLPEGYRIVLVGLSRSQLQQVAPDIIGIERTENQEQLAQLYSTANVFVNLSQEETFGMVTAEALACGTPCIVSDKTACPEVVDAGTGMVIDTANLDCVIEAVLSITKRGKPSYSEQCMLWARNMFDSKRMVKQYIEEYISMDNEV